MKIGIVKTQIVKGKLVFKVIGKIRDVPIEELKKSKRFKKASKKLKEDLAYIKKAQEIDPARLKMRFIG